MNLNLTPFVTLWIVLAAAVIVLIAWRKIVTLQEDETLHVMDMGAASHQVDVTHKLDKIDKWGKILTTITVIFGVALGALYLYRSWIELSRTGV